MANSATKPDIDPQETREWLEAVESLAEREGIERTRTLLETVVERARGFGAEVAYDPTTPYLNTIPLELEERSPGDAALEWRIRGIIRWNALAMVVQANRAHPGLGGHLASFASAATLYDVGFNHFFRAPNAEQGGDLLFIQGHSSPGIYARAYVEGRLTNKDLRSFRREVDGGLSSYPHPWLMADFWQFPTVSMGLGPIMAIYQARFMRYLANRDLLEEGGRKVWAFVGDGEMDQPESLGALSLAAREKLDNLIFVVNCNLQRLDGPVRGNGKIIQELEAVFRGAGWNVLKVIWGSRWDPLLARDKRGLLRKRMGEVVDGEYQAYKASLDGGFVRRHFFGKDPELERMVSHLTDEEILRLDRGGHDPSKVYAAFAAAVEHAGRPTVILAKTIKGYGLGESGEAMNVTHQQKKVTADVLKELRDRWSIPISDEELVAAPFYKPPDDSAEAQYLRRRREELGGFLPQRRFEVPALPIPGLEVFESLLQGSGEREMSTTMALVRILALLNRQPQLRERIVPIVADEARTFGMEGMFRQLGIYSPAGQLYEPVDAAQIAPYREARDGQILQEGICEAGAMSSWIAAGTAYSQHGLSMIPFYLFYSMFGYQRVGDLMWAAGDIQARGFLIGGTSGRTTLEGEGLQHQDGHGHLLMSVIPNCVSYDPAFAYELAVVVHDGLRRMYVDRESVFYYLSTMNENYRHPPMPEGAEEGIRRGLYRLRLSGSKASARVQLLGSGAILREVVRAAELLEEAYDVAADVWSVTSFTELRRDGQSVERWNRYHPEEQPRVPYVSRCLEDTRGPVVAATDYVATLADLIRPWVPRHYVVLGTDGFGRSDTRERLRSFFEVDRDHIAVAALKALVDVGKVEPSTVTRVIRELSIDPDKPAPAIS